MTAKQVAKMLQVAESTVVTWRSRGGGPPFSKAGGQVRYLRADVIAYMDGRMVKPGEDE